MVHWVASSNKPSVMIIKWRVSLINVVDFDDICCQILNWSNENSAYDIKCGQDNIVVIINEIKNLWSYESTFPVHGLAELVEDPGIHEVQLVSQILIKRSWYHDPWSTIILSKILIKRSWYHWYTNLLVSDSVQILRRQCCLIMKYN